MMLDEVDLKILETLRRNSRVSYSSMSRDVGISEAAVRKRVSRLLEAGVIERFTVEVDMGFKAMTFVSVEPTYPCSEVSRKILSIDGVEKVYEVSGEYDLAVLISTTGYREANRIIEAIRALKGVGRTYTMTILNTHYRP